MPDHISVEPPGASRNQRTRSVPSHWMSLFWGSSEKRDVLPFSRSRILISLPSECDSREYVDTVYNARLPFSLGTADDRRGADIKSLYDLLDHSCTIYGMTCSGFSFVYLRMVIFDIHRK